MNQGRPTTPIALRAPTPAGTEPPKTVPADMPARPDFLSAYAVEEWEAITPVLYDLGVLTDLDRVAIAGWCQVVGRWRLAEEMLAKAAADDADKLGGMVSTTDAGNKVQSVLLTVANGALRDMLKFASEFGMTPSARARIEGKRGEGPQTGGSKYFGKK